MADAAEPKAQPGTAAAGMGVAKGGWFTELSTMWPGQGLSLKVDEVLYQDRSKFQARRLLHAGCAPAWSCCRRMAQERPVGATLLSIRIRVA
jgi:hypothetical protein